MGSDSLLRAEDQASLFNSDALPVGLDLLLPEDEQRRQFSGEHVARNQERYRLIVKALGQNLPVRMICEAFGVSHHTVKAIREREPDMVATEKQRFSKLLGHAARMSVEGYLDDLQNGKVPSNVKSVSAAIFLDKKALLDGEATSRVEHVRADVPTIEEMRRVIEALPAADVADQVSDSQSEGKGEKAQ